MTKDNWIKAFDEKCNWTAPIHQGEYDDDLPIYGFEEAEKIIKSFISQVEKDAIEKTNKRWRKRCQKLRLPEVKDILKYNLSQRAGYNQALSDLLEYKEGV